MPEFDHIQVNGFQGLNTNMPEDQIADEEFQVLENFVHRRGTIEKRVGTILRVDLEFETNTYKLVGTGRILNATGFAGNKTYMFWLDETNHDFYSSTGYPTNDSSFFLLSNDVASVSSNIISGTDGCYCVYNLQSDPTQEYVAKIDPNDTGNEFVNIAGPFVGVWGITTWIFEHQDRLWILGYTFDYDVVNGAFLSYSEPGDYTTGLENDPSGIAGGNFIVFQSVNLHEAQVLGDKIILFGDIGGVWVVTTQGSPRNWSQRQLDNTLSIQNYRKNISVDGNHTTVKYGATQCTLKYKNLIYVLALDGLYVTDGVSINKLSQKVNNYVRCETDHVSSSTLVTPELPSICIFNHLYDEIIIRVPYSRKFPPKYFIYNIELGTWSEFIFGIAAPVDAPSRGSGFVALLDSSVTEYPYSFGSMQYVPEFGVGDTAPFPGLHLFSNQDLTEKNKVYVMHTYSVAPLDRFTYKDGCVSTLFDGTSYISRAKTKLFDFGYRGVNKKVVKQYMSLMADGSTQIDINVVREINGVELSDLNIALLNPLRNFKMAGPGYFDVYSLIIEDENAQAVWELQNLAFDVLKKPEQLSDTGS